MDNDSVALLESDASASALAGATKIGFKEWAVVCEALSAGRQSIILRKGGIAEGRDGFQFKHDRFFLFPTQYHQQMEKVRPEEAKELSIASPPPAGTIRIRLLMIVETAEWVADWGRLEALEPLHIWNREAIRERFEYEDRAGLQCAFGRIYQSAQSWEFMDRPAFGGCRSWVTLPDSPHDAIWTPVLDEETHARRREEVRQILHSSHL